MKKIYIGCSLTHAPEEFKTAIELLKSHLRKKYKILEFIGLINDTPQDVFEHDTECVKTCDLFVADCSHPGIGLGYELGVALEMNKPTLAVAQKDAKVTRLMLGVTKENFTFARYDDILDVVHLIEEKIKHL